MGRARPTTMMFWTAVICCLLTTLVEAAMKCTDNDEAFFQFKNLLPNDDGVYEKRGIQGFETPTKGQDNEGPTTCAEMLEDTPTFCTHFGGPYKELMTACNATCHHGTCNSKKGSSKVYDDYDANKPLRDPFLVSTHPRGCEEFEIEDKDDWITEQYNFLWKGCSSAIRHLMWSAFCVSTGREVPLYPTFGTFCPQACGLCVSEFTSLPSTRRNDPQDNEQIQNKLPWNSDPQDGDVEVDNPDMPGDTIMMSASEYARKHKDDPKKTFPLFYKRNDGLSRVSDNVLKTSGRSTWEGQRDDFPIWSPNWWVYPPGLEEKGLPDACNKCDGTTAPRLVNCFDRGITSINAPGMPQSPWGTCPESDDGVTVCGDKSPQNGKQSRNPYDGYHSITFDSNELTIVTRRFGLTFHREVQKLSIYANNVVSLAVGCFKHLTRVYDYGLGNNKLTGITAGQFMGMESLELYWQFGHNDLLDIPVNWWHTGEDKNGNLTVGRGMPVLRWYSTPLMDKYTEVSQGECCSQFQQLRILEMQSTSVNKLPADYLHGLTHLQSLYLEKQELTELPKDFAKDLDSIYYFDMSHNDIVKIEKGGVPTGEQLSKVIRYNMAGNPSTCFQGVNLETGEVSQDKVSCSCGAGYYANDKDYCVEATCPTAITFPAYTRNYNDDVDYGDCNDGKGGIKTAKLTQGTTCTVTCKTPYEGQLDYLCSHDGQWKSKSGRVLECIEVHNYQTVYGSPGEDQYLKFTVPVTVESADQLTWDPARQWDEATVVDHFGKAHAQEVDLLATMDIILKCIDGPSIKNGGIKLGPDTLPGSDKLEKGQAAIRFKWKAAKGGGFLFDGKDDGLSAKQLEDKKKLEDRCDYDFSAMVRAEDGFITAGGAGLTRGVVRVFTSKDCTKSGAADNCVFYDQKLVFQRSLLQRPTVLFPIRDIEGATGGCVNKDFVDGDTPYGNEPGATCDGGGNSQAADSNSTRARRQGYTQGQEVDMASTIKWVNTASTTYGEFRQLEIYNGIDARVEFVAGDTLYTDEGQLNNAEGVGLPKGLYLEKGTGKIKGTLGEHGEALNIKVTAIAIDDSCQQTADKCTRETEVMADFTFPAAETLREEGQTGITATVGNVFQGGRPEMEGGRLNTEGNLIFTAIGDDLPDGLVVDRKTGQVKGTPTKATTKNGKPDGKPEEVTVGILATDANGYEVEIGTLGITVRAAITPTWANPLPEIVINNQIPEYDSSTAEELTQPLFRILEVRWKGNGTLLTTKSDTVGPDGTKVVLPRLPAGIKFNGGRGDFYSEPTEPGEFEVKVQAEDAEKSTATVKSVDGNEYITLTVHECTKSYNCNGQGECQHGDNLYDGTFSCACNGDYKDEVGGDGKTFCGQKIDKASRALGIVIALAFIFGIAGVAGYKYRVYTISMRAFDFESELKRMLDSGEMDADGVGNAGFPREIKRANVVLIEMIGEGQFGEVFKGELDESASGGAPGYAVAVKTSKEAEGEGAEEMVREAAVMAQLSGHKNLVSLIGVVTSGVPLLLVISICENGSLLSFVKQRTLDNNPMSDPEKLGYCQDVAVGMAYLAKKRFVHRDLAARNILVDSMKNAKVADFGLTRAAGGGDTGGANGEAKDDYYKSQRGVFPVRWTAPEAMETLRFTIATDVWAWAITVTEIFANGLRPYDGMNNATVITQVMAGYRHPKPAGCPEPVYQIMLRCWMREPQDRPSFSQVEEDLGALFDRETLSFATGVNLAGVLTDDNYNIGGDGAAAAVEESSYSIGGDAAGAAAPAPASFLVAESSYSIGGDAAPAAAAAAGGGDDANTYTDMGGNNIVSEAAKVATADPFAPIKPAAAAAKAVVSLTSKKQRGSTADTAGLLDNVDEECLYEI